MERYGLMLDEDGTPINSVIDLSSGLHNVFIPSFSISPPDTTFNVLSDTIVDKGKPFTYYELLYSGIDGNSLRIAYHEYSPDNLVRPAFVQELTYPVFQSELTFRNLKLEILSSDSQQVWFMVVDDRGVRSPLLLSADVAEHLRAQDGLRYGSGVHGPLSEGGDDARSPDARAAGRPRPFAPSQTASGQTQTGVPLQQGTPGDCAHPEGVAADYSRFAVE